MSVIKKVACVGSGVIGASWATCFALNGYSVSVYLHSEIKNTKVSVDKNLEFFVEKDVITAEQSKEISSRITYTKSLEEAVKDTIFMQECGPDKYEVKQATLKEIDKYSPADSIYASSTSGLLITEIAKYSDHPERCIVGHPFNPPHLIPLVEIAKGERTEQKYVDKAVEFYKSCKKEPIVMQKEKVGFIANRIAHAVNREVIDLVVSGTCTIEDVDKAVTYGPGLRWAIIGPTMVYELGSGSGGISSMNKFASTANMIYADLADWKEMPEEWGEINQAGVDEEKANLPDFIGHTNEEISKFRDSTLVELLKLHHKL